MTDNPEFSLRPARLEDDLTIRRMIRQEHLNPQNLHWPQFTVAIDHNGTMIGCGQVKIHSEEVHELASLVVHKEWRGKGVASALINNLIATHPGVLYLTCRASLEPLYEHFGFVSIPLNVMPPNFRSMYRLINGILALFGQRGGFKVMRRIP
ncbi:MAG TPA: GNAT family N-acetyltransferase [Anaerolineales bacterium]|nr:GNAT family N-acetyltransferase [Anaerolineales bacterium]